MRTIDDLIEMSDSYDQNKFDIVAPPERMAFNDNGDLAVSDLFHNPTPLALTPWAAQQVCSWLKTPWSYLRRCLGGLRADNWNEWLGHKEKARLVRGYGGTCRALVSGEYSPVYSTEVMARTRDMLGGNMPYELVRPYVSADTLLHRR
jgi:hypothetical protein